ncbi:MAG: mechanosensitive ion channel family protein [bacterium]
MLSLLAVLLFGGMRWLFDRYVNDRVDDDNKRHMAIKTGHYLIGFLFLISVGNIWFGGSSGLVAYVGIVSAGLAIALQDVLAGLAGWIFIVIRRQFKVGDRIEIGEHAGDVIDIRLFAFSLMEIGNWVDDDQSTGRIINIPNGWVFKKPIANYTQGFDFIWNELPLTVTFESDWKKAKKLLAEIAGRLCPSNSQDAAKQIKRIESMYIIHFQHLTPIVWTSLSDSGVTLTVRYLCKPRKRRVSADKMWEEILIAFAAEDDINLAYPTWRFYNNLKEGKQ